MWAERITAGRADIQDENAAFLGAGGKPPAVNKGGRPKGSVNKFTPTVERMIVSMKAEQKPVAHIARELRVSRQTVYEVLRQHSAGRR